MALINFDKPSLSFERVFEPLSGAILAPITDPTAAPIIRDNKPDDFLVSRSLINYFLEALLAYSTESTLRIKFTLILPG